MRLDGRQRQRNWRFGVRAETAAAWFLRLKGYRIKARRYRNAGGEIDLVAMKNRTVVFVEVKARPNERRGLEAITPRQRRRIERSAEGFLAVHGGFQGFDVRFDLIIIRPFKQPRHVVDAWRPGD